MEPLTREMIESGAELKNLLDRSGFPVSAMLWFYMVEAERWRLIIASPDVDKYGPKKAYRIIHSVIRESMAKLPEITWSDISAIGLENSLVSRLGLTKLLSIAKTGKGEGAKISKSGINGNYVESAYVYKI